jgi:hypothetical protein
VVQPVLLGRYPQSAWPATISSANTELAV